MAISRNVNFYTVGLPFLFLYRVDNWDDENRVDWAALWRAYSGVVDPNNGHVLNAMAKDTCYTPEEILERAYVGNLVTAEVAGDVKTVEHTVSVLGRKETDKVVLIRKSVDYNIAFDEMDVHLKNYLISKNISYPEKIKLVAKTTHRAPQSAETDFAEGEIEIVESGLNQVGENMSSLEYILTKRLRDQGTNFGPFDDGGTQYTLAGIYYFLVADAEREPVIENVLENYRGRVICGYFKYDTTEQMMKLQDFPANMDGSGYSYKDTTIHPKIKVLVTDNGSPSGIKTNTTLNDRSIIELTQESYEWVIDSTNPQSFTINLPATVMRGSVMIRLSGQKYDATAGWVDLNEAIYDLPISQSANDVSAPINTGDSSNPSYLLDAGSKITYGTGTLTLTPSSGVISDMTANGLDTMRVKISMTYASAASSVILWTGLVWAKDSKAFTSVRVVKPKLEIEGTALVVFKNNVGVSFVHVLPRVVFKPDGTIDFAKDDWEKGSFVISVIRDESAFIPYLPSKIWIPFGFINTFRIVGDK